MPVRWVERSSNVSAAERGKAFNAREEVEAYDALPASVRAALRACVSDLSATDARRLVKQFGPRLAIGMLKASDRLTMREVLAEHYPGHPTLARR